MLVFRFRCDARLNSSLGSAATGNALKDTFLIWQGIDRIEMHKRNAACGSMSSAYLRLCKQSPSNLIVASHKRETKYNSMTFDVCVEFAKKLRSVSRKSALKVEFHRRDAVWDLFRFVRKKRRIFYEKPMQRQSQVIGENPSTQRMEQKGLHRRMKMMRTSNTRWWKLKDNNNKNSRAANPCAVHRHRILPFFYFLFVFFSVDGTELSNGKFIVCCEAAQKSRRRRQKEKEEFIHLVGEMYAKNPSEMWDLLVSDPFRVISENSIWPKTRFHSALLVCVS